MNGLTVFPQSVIYQTPVIQNESKLAMSGYFGSQTGVGRNEFWKISAGARQ
jgi:hypothetical protein